MAKKKHATKTNNSGLWVALVLGVVAIVGLVLLYQDMKPSGAAVVKGFRGGTINSGISAAEKTGWDLGSQVALSWDGSEVREYCSVQCGNACARAVDSQGSEQANCYGSCRGKCENDVLSGRFGITAS